MTELLGLILHACGLGKTPGVVALGLGETDLIGVLLGKLGRLGEGRAQHQDGGAGPRCEKQLAAGNQHAVSSLGLACTGWRRWGCGERWSTERAYLGKTDQVNAQPSPPEFV